MFQISTGTLHSRGFGSGKMLFRAVLQLQCCGSGRLLSGYSSNLQVRLRIIIFFFFFEIVKFFFFLNFLLRICFVFKLFVIFTFFVFYSEFVGNIKKCKFFNKKYIFNVLDLFLVLRHFLVGSESDHKGSDPAGSGSATLHNTTFNFFWQIHIEERKKSWVSC